MKVGHMVFTPSSVGRKSNKKKSMWKALRAAAQFPPLKVW